MQDIQSQVSKFLSSLILEPKSCDELALPWQESRGCRGADVDSSKTRNHFSITVSRLRLSSVVRGGIHQVCAIEDIFELQPKL